MATNNKSPAAVHPAIRSIKLSGAPRNVLEMARLDGLFPQFDDEKKAIASFEEGQ